MPSGAATKAFFTKRGALPLRVAKNNVASKHPYHTYSVYTKKKAEVIQEYVYMELKDGVMLADLARVVADYI
jgi:hypothetical protein